MYPPPGEAPGAAACGGGVPFPLPLLLPAPEPFPRPLPGAAVAAREAPAWPIVLRTVLASWSASEAV